MRRNSLLIQPLQPLATPDSPVGDKVEDPSNPAPPKKGPPPGEKKVLTKAERREIQERQRAAKAASQTQGKPGIQGASKKEPAGSSAPPPSSQKSKPTKSATVEENHGGPSFSSKSKDAHDVTAKSTISEPAGLEKMRIFSHFGAPKAIASLGVGIKGDIHPVVRKLGLQLADFRIVGANARCIATLTAFKAVSIDYSL